MYFTVAALTAVFMMSINLNANTNSNLNAYATIINETPNVDDIGQSAECVIVVVGCDGTGSVGSSGDTIIGSFNGKDDNNTQPNVPNQPNIPLCLECIDMLSPIEQVAIIQYADNAGITSLEELCSQIYGTSAEDFFNTIVDLPGMSQASAQELIDCLVQAGILVE